MFRDKATLRSQGFVSRESGGDSGRAVALRLILSRGGVRLGDGHRFSPWLVHSGHSQPCSSPPHRWAQASFSTLFPWVHVVCFWLLNLLHRQAGSLPLAPSGKPLCHLERRKKSPVVHQTHCWKLSNFLMERIHKWRSWNGGGLFIGSKWETGIIGSGFMDIL